jgi:hypothetical protein
MNRTALKRHKPLRAKWKPVPADKQAWGGTRPSKGRSQFRARTPANRFDCARGCGQRARTWHHWVPKHAIRREVPAGAVTSTLRDERNLTPLCFRCHMDGEAVAGSRPFTAGEIPASAWEFARELGTWAVLRLEQYPTRGGTAHDDGGPHG